MRAWSFLLSVFLLAGCPTSSTPTPAACRHASDCTDTVCVVGACVAPTSCASSRACPGLVCDTAAGRCADCVLDGDCDAGARCVADVCIPSVACTSDRDCSSMSEVCDASAHECAECNVDADCAASARCSGHACVTRGPSDAGSPLDASVDAARSDGGMDAGGGAAADGGHDAASSDGGMFSTCVEGWYFTDVDGDGYGDLHDVVRACTAPAGRVSVAGDCNDHDPAKHPGATEACTGGLDDDCDGTIDEGCPCSAGTTRPCGLGVGACVMATQQCEFSDSDWGACNSPPPIPESCNGVDDDCDGTIDEGGDAACGAGATCDATGTCSHIHPAYIVTNDRTSYALMSDGSLYVWGNGSVTASAVPSSTGGSEVRAIAATEGLVCFTNVSEHLWCASDCGLPPPGVSGGGVCGNPISYVDHGVFSAVDLMLGTLIGCLVAPDRSVACWGDGRSGQLGLGATASTPNPIAITGLGPVRGIDEGAATCAVETSGAVRCWGRNDDGDLGGGTVGASSATLVDTGITDGVAVAGGYAHYCAQRASGDVMCWGSDNFGELGDGASTLSPDAGVTRSATPVRMQGIPSGSKLPTHLADASTCVITPSGGVMCVGYGLDGELGDGLGTSSTTPVTVTGLSGVLQLTGFDEHWCALTATEVWCWGSGTAGQVGTGYLVPGRITGLP